LVNANRGQLVATLQGVTQTSEEMRQVAAGLNQTVKQVNHGLATVDTQKVAKNLEALVANAEATSRNLQDISKSFNDPTLLANLKKTLDSARFTFENVQKITSDVDELTGDPVLRDKVRKLILGLGNLMSSTQQIEQQFYASQVLDSLSQQVGAQVDYQIDVQQRFATFNQPERPPIPLVSRFSPPPAIANRPLPAQEK
jgi:phospholipid/cholesterol/gamma-HCH transport system substrate-binding protein